MKFIQKLPGYKRLKLSNNTSNNTSNNKIKRKYSKVLLAENFHLNTRNFGSLLKFMNTTEAEITIGIELGTTASQLMIANGNYGPHQDILSAQLETLNELTSDDVNSFQYRGFNLWNLAYPEVLVSLLHEKIFQSYEIADNYKSIIPELFQNHKSQILSCFAAAIYWIDYWQSIKGVHKYHTAIVFSGAHIYAATLLRILRETQVRCFVCESFMTGNHYLLEHRYTPLPNASNALRELSQIHETQKISYTDIIKAHNHFTTAKNKNVVQPPDKTLPISAGNNEVCLIIGQVINDYSIITGAGSLKNTIPTYEKLLGGLLKDPDRVVIFKAHPWEGKRQISGRNFTFEYLQEFIKGLPLSQQKRVLLVDNWNLNQLLRVSDRVFTLCSQAGIDAARAGFKPYIIGGSFYGNCGFTNDFDDVTALLHELENNSTSNLLNLSEYKTFERHMAGLFKYKLVAASSAEDKKLNGLFSTPQTISHQKVLDEEFSATPDFECVS
ncbi:hypothetical protein [Pseudovibrio sp. Tun.PSC04-5.I4]|uniref:capsular polysaccharide export protein, LipB/KpsS family n=1 Tax=Pseudovibrio sp. Tun.PSC04-5.I4 TaxID=1798213 RepID=UPI000890D0F2|nr:hypothetical protein [Pseudovibrio sp. Tun.PSC04-5.I4]SDR37815.1 Capsule polysaccharide biosynthesis protein [Pseudovibrio sp. Tun.PSC04-5.I4]